MSTRWTEQQVREYNLRMAGVTERTTVAPEAVTDESELHDEIMAYCRSKDWVCLHGSMAHRTFRTIGECDFQIYASDSRAFLIECKSKTGKVSPEQQAFAAQAWKNGHTVHLVRSMTHFLELVK